MRTAGPYAITVLAINLVAVAQARDNVDGLRVDHPAGPVVALEEFGLQRSLIIAAVQGAFAVYFLWAARRRSPGVLAVTGLVTGLYLIGSLPMGSLNPIISFPSTGSSSPPFVRLDPTWYYPSLQLVVWAAVITQLVALVLAIRSSHWRLGHRGPRLLVFGPLLAVAAYAAINLVAIYLAMEPRTPTDVFGSSWTDSSRYGLVSRARETVKLLGYLMIPLGATALVACLFGWRMRRRGVTPGTLVPLCLFSVPYLAFLGLFTWWHPLSKELNYDDQAGYIFQNPPWHPIALVALCVLAVVAQATALVRTSKSGLTGNPAGAAGVPRV